VAKKILAVDDEAHILHVVTMKLSNAGFDTVTAQDGDEALEAFMAERPDLVITDLQMPHMTGLEFATALRQEHNIHDVPVIMLTARGFDLDPSEMEAAGISDVLEKPFSPRDVLARVEALLADHADATPMET